MHIMGGCVNRDSVQWVGPYIARRARGWEGERIGIRCEPVQRSPGGRGMCAAQLP